MRCNAMENYEINQWRIGCGFVNNFLEIGDILSEIGRIVELSIGNAVKWMLGLL